MGKPLVLVVDDDTDTCQLLALILNGNNCRVELAFDGFEGIEKAARLKPDLVLLDVMMPGMDGWETCQRIKAAQSVPVVFITVKNDIHSIATGMKLGACDFIVKPFTVQDIRARVSTALDEQGVTYKDLPLAVAADADETERAARGTGVVFFHSIKRFMDIFGAATALVLLFPILLLIAAFIRLESSGPAIFKQERVGFKPGGLQSKAKPHTFVFYKFRTMAVSANSDLHRSYVTALIQNDEQGLVSCQNESSEMRKLVDDPRITRIGKFLRKTSLDELPQFWNVLRGDMSLVGPRPPIPYEVAMYRDWHLRRFDAKPGLTGLWQVSARSDADFDAMVRLDLWYIDHQSLLLDLKILLQTPFAVLSMRGAI